MATRILFGPRARRSGTQKGTLGWTPSPLSRRATYGIGEISLRLRAPVRQRNPRTRDLVGHSRAPGHFSLYSWAVRVHRISGDAETLADTTRRLERKATLTAWMVVTFSTPTPTWTCGMTARGSVASSSLVASSPTPNVDYATQSPPRERPVTRGRRSGSRWAQLGRLLACASAAEPPTVELASRSYS